MKKIIGGAALAGLVVLAIAATALATGSHLFSTEQLSLGRFGQIDVKNESDGHELELKTKGNSDVYVVKTPYCPEATPVGIITPVRAWSPSRRAPRRSTTATIPRARRTCTRQGPA